MVQTVRSPLLRYGIAILAVAIAISIKLLIEPFVQVEAPFLLLFAAIMVAALLGGRVSGIGATVLAAVASNYFFFPPPFAFNFNLGATLQLILFALEGMLITQVIVALANTRRRIQLSQEALHNAYADLEQRVHDRTIQLSEANQQLQQQIAEREQMEQALRESDRRFRAIFNQTFQFIGLMQPDGTLIEANQTALNFAGLHSRDVINRPFWEAYWWTISEETQNRLRAAIAEAATGKFVRYEDDVRGKDGAIVTIDFSINPIKDEAGQVVLLIPEGRDITDLKQSQQILHSFFDSASMMMGIVELVGDDILHIIDNAAAGRFLGTDPAHLKQRLASEIGTPNDNIQIWVNHYREAERSRTPVRFEYPHITAEGQQFWLSATVCQIPGHFADRSRFAYIVEDISDRKRAQLELERTQAALQAANDRLRGIIDGSHDLIAALDLEFCFIALNRSYRREFQQIFGRYVSVGMSLIATLAHIPDEQAKAVALWSRALQGEEFTVVQELGDNRTRQTYEITFSSIRNAQGELIGASHIMRNVTERIRIEEEIRRLNVELEQRVQQRTAQLEAINRLLEQEVRDRRAAEWELAKSEQQFRLLTESMPQIVWTATPEGTVDYYNQRWAEYSGIPVEQGQGWGWQPVLHPEDEQRTMEVWSEALRTGELYECEHRVRRADGQFRWFLSRGLPLKDSQGKIIKWFGTATDIHEQKQVQEDLRESQERFRQLAETVQDVFWLLDTEKEQILYVSPAYEEIWGRSREDLYAHKDDWLQAIHPQDQEQLQTVLSQAGSWEGFDQTYRVVRPDGSVRWIRDRGFPVYNAANQIYRIAGLAEDITERKQIEAELQTRVLQQAAIATLGQRALASTDLNQLMEETVQLTAQTLQVPYCKVLQLLPDRQHLLIQWGVGWPADLLGQATVSTDSTSHAGHTLSVQEAVVVNDLPHDPRFTGSPLLHQQGIVGGITVAIAGDPHPFGVLAVHTTRLRTFTQDDVNFLVAISNILAETIQRQQTREALQQQSIELQRANRLKDEFLATISHELRTPLNSMMGWAKLLPTRQFDAATTARAIDSISRNTQTLAQLVEDVLDMSDILTGQLKLQMAPVDLTLITEQAIASLDLATQAKKIEINLHSTLTTETVLGDATRLQQVVWNLLSNAIKFTSSGGRVDMQLDSVECSVLGSQSEDPTQNSKLNPQNSYVRLTVTDTGKGISPEFLPFVFDRFRQEDGSITRSQGGLGLGLAIVRYLVELHGGTIQAASPGIEQGATFTVWLPIAQ